MSYSRESHFMTNSHEMVGHKLIYVCSEHVINIIF